MLNVSHPRLINLLGDGKLAFHRAGKLFRVKFADLMQHKKSREHVIEEAMVELARQAQESDMGYE